MAPLRAVNPGSETGKSGLVFTSQGSVDEEFIISLYGRKGLEIYREMSENDPTVGAIIFAITMLSRQVKWRVDENEDAEDAEGDAEFLKGCMDDLSHSWEDHISEVLSMVVYGWSWFEIVYKKRDGYQEESDRPNAKASSMFEDGKIGWRKFAIRSQDSLDRWDFDENGNVLAMIQKPPPSYEEIRIPVQKSLLFRTTTAKGNPEGRSMLRTAYRPWYYKSNIEETEAIGVERDLAGLPIAKVDPDILRTDADPEQVALKREIQKIIRNIKRNKEEGVMWPLVFDENGNELYRLELMSAGGTRQFDTNAIIGRYDQRITMTVLADFILLGHEKVGSFALSSDKTDLFAVALGAILDSIEAVYNRFAVPRLFRMNGMSVEHLPKIRHGDIETPPLTDIIQYVSGLVSAGVPLFPDEQLENHLRELGNLPERSEDAPDPNEQPEEEDQYEEEPQEEDGEQPDGSFFLNEGE